MMTNNDNIEINPTEMEQGMLELSILIDEDGEVVFSAEEEEQD
jgi:hypothetical protein